MRENQGHHLDDLRTLLAQEVEMAQQTELQANLADWPQVDLQTLFSEMAALKSEVRAETVAIREQREQLQTTLRWLEESLQQAQKREESAREQLEQVRKQLTKQLIDAWIDALERSGRSYEKARQLAIPVRKWWRTITNPAAESLAEGLKLTQQHLLSQLRALGVQAIPTVGLPFDAQKMEALDTRHDPHQEEGVVLEELMAGYTDAHGIRRMAQVVVNRKKGI